MNYERDRVMIMCRAADASVLAEVLRNARRRSSQASIPAKTPLEEEHTTSTLAIIDDVLGQIDRSRSRAGPQNRPVVLAIRDPDYENEFVVDGEVEIIDVDLGRGFDGRNGFGKLEPEEQKDWTRSAVANVAHLPGESNLRRAVEELVVAIAG